jgi:hypothetical protein
VGELTAALLPVSACRPALLTLELGMLTHLACLAIGVLAEFCRGVIRNGGRVRLADTPRESVREALVRTELLNLFEQDGYSHHENERGTTVNAIAKTHEVERAFGMTWGQLAVLEPRLNELLWKARQAGSRCRCGEEASFAFGPLRNAMADLVGFRSDHRDHPVLGSVGAYEVAYWRLYDAVVCLVPKPSVAAPQNSTAVDEKQPARPVTRRSSPAFAMQEAGQS